MEGLGVTNYASDKPTFALTPSTTEFDDALLQRNIVTHAQVMMAKGASSTEEVHRLTQLSLTKENETKNTTKDPPTIESSPEDPSDEEEDSWEDDDDEVLQRYRRQRTAQWQQQSSSIQYIQKSDWHRCVNEPSHHQYVVVCLTSSDTERTGCMERAVHALASSVSTTNYIQFVLIPYQQAIDDKWPLSNLPCLFLYRHGVLQKQWIGMAQNHTPESLQELLGSQIEALESE